MPRLLRHPALRPVRRGRRAHGTIVQHLFRHARLSPAARGRRAARSPHRPALRADAQGSAASGVRAPASTRAPSSSGRSAVPASILRRSPRHRGRSSSRRWRSRGLVPCFTTEFERRTIGLGFPDGTVAELCVDRGEIRATARRAREARRDRRNRDGARAMAMPPTCSASPRTLAADLPLAVMIDSKAARGYALRRGLQGAAAGPGARGGSSARVRCDRGRRACSHRPRVPAPDRGERAGARGRRRPRVDSPDARRHAASPLMPLAHGAVRARRRSSTR